MNALLPSHSRWLIPASMLVAPIALGIEGPKDDAAPPAVMQDLAAAAEAAEQQRIAFIGLVTERIPELLTIHLGIRDGEGVLVSSVMPDGPAADAGIRANDIILAVNGMSATSPAELSNIIRSLEPGEEVKVDLIQAGEGTDLMVTLGERPVQIAQWQNADPNQFFRMQGIPKDLEKRFRDMIGDDMMQFHFDGADINPGLRIPDLERDMDNMRQQLNQLREQQNELLNDAAPMGFNANSTMRLMDNEGSVELDTANGESSLTVRDKDGEIQWQGPWNNDEDKAKAPEHIRNRAGNLNMGQNGFRLEFGE